MIFLTKLRPLKLVTHLKIQHIILFNFSNKHFTSKTPSKPHGSQPKKQPNSKNIDNDSLFSDITDILGTVDLTHDGKSSSFSISSASEVGFNGDVHCTPGVRQNALERIEGESEEKELLRDAQMGILVGNDVSGVVKRITEIVRGDHDGISMKERLDDLGCQVDSDVVVKVLKRCFKVPHLAKRFFDWVKEKNESCVTTEVYNVMLYIAGEAKDFELVERLVEEMARFNCEKDVKTWTILIMHYGKEKLVGKALVIFEKMRRSGVEPDAEAYRILILLLCKSRKSEIALEFYKEMVKKNFELDNELYRPLLNCIASTGDVDGVYLVADGMINVSLIPEHEVYSCVLKIFCIAGRIKEALELIRDLKDKNVTLSPQDLETLVKGLCRTDRMDDALEIVDIMKNRNVVNEVVYGALVNGYLRKGDNSKALDLFNSMKKAGFTPLISTYTELMQQHFRLNEYEKGCALYSEMLDRGVNLDIVAYTAVIGGHVRNDQISAAWNLLERLKEEGIRLTQKCYLIFIKELCRSSRSDEIMKFLHHMTDTKINIGKEISHCVVSYFKRKKDIANLEKLKEMLGSLRHCSEVEKSQDGSSDREMQSVESNLAESNADCLLLDPLPQTYNDEDLQNVCAILSSEKDWCAMQGALEKLSLCYTPNLVSEILQRCCQYGCAVLHFFSWVRKHPGYRHTIENYNMAMKIAGKGKDFKHMRNLFYEMQRTGYSVTGDTWTIIIMQYGRVGLTDIALRFFSEMKASGCKPTTSTYKYLILSLCGKKGRKVDEAVKLFREMFKAELVPDKELVEVCFDCFCQAGKTEDAKRCLEYLRKVGFSTPLSYSLLIRALCRTGKLEDALALANDVKGDRSTLDHYIYGSLIHGLLRKGLLDEALAKIDSMKDVGIHPTVHVYTSLVAHFCKTKNIDRALDIFRTMWKEGCHPTVVTYTALIHGYIDMGNFEDAQKLFLRMRLKGPIPDFKAYSTLISRLCDRGKSETALDYLSEMLNDGIVPSTINFRTVFFGLNREGKQHLAQTAMRLKHAVSRKRKFLAP